jgi:hypothetical protein
MDVAVLQTELRALREQVTSLQRENTGRKSAFEGRSARLFWAHDNYQ